jgi:hypothetical protein
MGRRRVVWCLAVALMALGAALALSGGRRPSPTAEELAFLARHWQRPIPPQGPPPASFAPIEASLAPQDCGVCHPAQYQDWQSSLHAQSMGPGVLGQLVELLETDPAEALFCQTCHAPLSEQLPKLPAADGGVPADNPHYQPPLRAQGLVCAACHVRQHRRFGPPKRPEAPPSPPVLPHGGVTRTTAFQRSEFCMGCHQFEEDGFALNGKLLQNTHREWQASRYAEEGVQCQDCHMPDRRHLWRGIHDPDTVKAGVTITLTTARPSYRPGQTLKATLQIANSGVGHYFPTYVTPQVVARFVLVAGDGTPVPDTEKEAVIGREVRLDLSQEVFDTRIPPGETFTIAYTQKVPRAGLRLRATVTVYPDQFYTRFFQAILDGGQAVRGRALIQQALERTRASPFVIFAQEVPVS